MCIFMLVILICKRTHRSTLAKLALLRSGKRKQVGFYPFTHNIIPFYLKSTDSRKI